MINKAKQYDIYFLPIIILFSVTAFAMENGDEITKVLFGDAISTKITQAGFFFIVAAWFHSARVKKEIAKNFSSLTNSIDNLALTLRDELKTQSVRIDNLNVRVGNIEAITTTKQQGETT